MSFKHIVHKHNTQFSESNSIMPISELRKRDQLYYNVQLYWTFFFTNSLYQLHNLKGLFTFIRSEHQQSSVVGEKP